MNHIRNVLRMTPGEKITVSSGADGKEYFCEIRRLQEDQVIAEILEQKDSILGASIETGFISGSAQK